MLKTIRLFLGEVRRDFRTIGALAPSSPALAKAMMRPLADRPNRPIRVLEVGAGTGAITARLVRCLRAGDCLDVIEMNPVFCRHLSKRLAREARRGVTVRLHQADIRQFQAVGAYDYILSGLPFANFEAAAVSQIVAAYLGMLAPDGVLSFFEYVLPHRLRLVFLPPLEQARLRNVMNLVRSYRRAYETRTVRIWLNLPPARARHLKKH